MADMKLALMIGIAGVERFGAGMRQMGSSLTSFVDGVTKGSKRLAGMSERMVEWGERVGIASAVLSEGADKLHEWTEAMSEPALGMQQSMASMAAMTGLAGDQLDKLKEHAVEFSDTHAGVTAEQWAQGFTRMRGVFQDTGKAMRAEDVAGMLSKVGIDSQSAANLISQTYASLGADAKSTGDQLTRTIQLFGATPPQQLAMSLGRLAGAAKISHTSTAELFALTGQAGQLIQGGRGAQMFASMIQQFVTAASEGKNGIDISHGLLNALRQVRGQISGLSGVEQAATLKDLGFGSQGAMLIPFLDKLDEVSAKQREIANSAGTLGKAYATATGDAKDQIALLHQNVSNLYDAMLTPALPTVNGWMARLTNVTRSAAGATEHHSTVARYAAISMTAVGGAAYYGIQGLSALGTMSVFAGKGLQALKYAGKALDFESWALRAMYFWEAIGKLNIATRLWTGAQWALNAAMDANPVVLAIGAAVALGVAAYELYEHWSAVSGFFANLWARVKGIFGGALGWMKTAGVEMMKRLGEGILAGIEWPFKAASHVAGMILDHFKMHSPAKLGPLHEFHHLGISETIAAAIRPAPVVSAARRTAMESRSTSATRRRLTRVRMRTPRPSETWCASTPVKSLKR